MKSATVTWSNATDHVVWPSASVPRISAVSDPGRSSSVPNPGIYRDTISGAATEEGVGQMSMHKRTI